MTIDVSAVIPTFRRPAQLGEAIRSVLGQEGVSVEAIVVDDSPEGSAKAVVEAIADPRVSWLQHSPPTGGVPGKVRNLGWPRAKGRYVQFLDDDDRVAAGAYRAMTGALDAAPDKGVCFGRVEPFGEVPEVLAHQRAYFADASKRARRAARFGSRRLMVANMLYGNTVMVCSAGMVRREGIAAIGGFSHEVRVVEDVDFYIRAMRTLGVVYLDRVVLHYRTGAPSIMHDQKNNAVIERSYGLMFDDYRSKYGRAEMAVLKVLGRVWSALP